MLWTSLISTATCIPQSTASNCSWQTSNTVLAGQCMHTAKMWLKATQNVLWWSLMHFH